MREKAKAIKMLISFSGKNGMIILLFSLTRYVVNQLNECGISVLIPALIIKAFEDNNYVKLLVEVICFFCIFLLLLVILDRIDTVHMRRHYTEVSKNILFNVYKKIAESDISRFDDSAFYEKNILNMNNIEAKTFAAIENVSKMLGCVVAFCINLSLIIFIIDEAWIFITVALGMSLLLQIFQTRFNLDYQKQVTVLNRRADILGNIFMSYDYAREIKNQKRFVMLHEKVMQEKETALAVFKAALPKFVGYSFGKLFAATFTLRVMLLIYLMYRSMVYNEYAYTNVIVAYNAAINLFLILNNIITICSKYDDIVLYAEQYNEIMNYQNEIISGSKVLDCFEALEFKNVCFKYKGQEAYVLDHVSFKIEKGQKVALVGRNGNGKSTLMKLILRMYEPQSGEILVNSVNIKEYDLNSYRNYFGVLFQDSTTFNATVKENVCFDNDIGEGFYEILKNVGIFERINEMEKKEDSELGVDIFQNGTILSGGEQQRILVARALAKNADVILMDEPTSHIDPSADMNFSAMIYDKLSEKTVLYITHRLISTKRSDKILVLNNEGQLECGTHEELLICEGLYKNMYDAQMRNYSVMEQ